jgi:hypothetical protein
MILFIGFFLVSGIVEIICFNTFRFHWVVRKQAFAIAKSGNPYDASFVSVSKIK